MWWRYYGFESNPLDVRPSEKVIGLEKEEEKIVSCIEGGEMFLVFGPLGSGKTSLALKIKNKLKNKYIFIYLNGEENPKPPLLKTINEFRKKFSLGPIKIYDKRKIVLILDELQSFSKETLLKVKALYDSKKVHSVFLVQISPEIDAPPSFVNRISNKIEIRLLSEDAIKEIIFNRLKNKIKISDDFLSEIIKLCNYNVRSVLIELSKVFSSIKHPIRELDKKVLLPKIEEKTTVDLKVSPQQLLILEKLIGRKLTIKDLENLTNISYNTVSKQISRLQNKGLVVKIEKDGKVYYTINPKAYNDVVKMIGK